MNFHTQLTNSLRGGAVFVLLILVHFPKKQQNPIYKVRHSVAEVSLYELFFFTFICF
jgi:hypothetical protein